jgi:hypothetical protein
MKGRFRAEVAPRQWLVRRGFQTPLIKGKGYGKRAKGIFFSLLFPENASKAEPAEP